MSLMPIEEAIKIIDEHEDYKVIKRFEKIDYYNQPDDKPKSIGIFLDTETTGTNHYNDQIIELALVPFEYSNDGKIYKLLESYAGLQDPNITITPFITKLTGITNEMVAGKTFDQDKINNIVSSASLIIAHNAAFDRKFVEKLFPIFAAKPWACTGVEIPWREESITSAKLEYLAYKFGVFYEAHRAEIDCLIGIHVLSQKLPISGELVLKRLLDNANSKHYRIWAERSPFLMKDILKARGYRWNDGNNEKPKAWFKEVSEELKEEELEFLYKEIYQYEIMLPIEEICALNRFSDR
jgi:DNA polymerase-3 subunit epsilon